MFSPILLFKHFYILIILGGLANYFVFRKRMKVISTNQPELEAGFKQILKAFLFFGTLPWLILAVGVLLGKVEHIFSVFQPANLNPVVLLFHASVYVIYILTLKFLFMGNGAEFLKKHISLFQNPRGVKLEPSAIQIKIFAGILVVFGMAILLALWFVKIPVDEILPF